MKTNECLSILGLLVSGAFILGIYFGHNIFDQSKIDLVERNKYLQDSIIMQRNSIKVIANNSDSALQLLGKINYDYIIMSLESRNKVQAIIESAGLALDLNSKYK